MRQRIRSFISRCCDAVFGQVNEVLGDHEVKDTAGLPPELVHKGFFRQERQLVVPASAYGYHFRSIDNRSGSSLRITRGSQVWDLDGIDIAVPYKRV